jgi:hypothetical protein
MQEAGRRARAALALAALLLAGAIEGEEPPGAGCPFPRELRAEGGHTRALACDGRPGGRPLRGPARRLLGLPIDPNQADAATLEALPRVGPGLAAAIVEARRGRRFASLAELDRVPGIGPRTIEALAGLLAIDAAPGNGGGGRLGPPRPDPLGCEGDCQRGLPRREP